MDRYQAIVDEERRRRMMVRVTVSRVKGPSCQPLTHEVEAWEATRWADWAVRNKFRIELESLE